MPAPFSVPDILGSLERPVLAVDADGRVANANAAALSMFGPEVATPGSALPLARPDLWQPMAKCLAEGEVVYDRLSVGPKTVVATTFLRGAGVLRLLALLPSAASTPLLHASAACWITCMALYLWRFVPMLIRPRPDRPLER